MNRRAPRFTVTVLVVALLAASCAQLQGSGPGPKKSGSDYAASCAAGAVLGAGAGAIIELYKNRNSGKGQGDILKSHTRTLAAAAAGGCVIGLAVTAIGQIMDDNQRAKHEEAMQRDAKRRAVEAQNYASTERRYQSAPAATTTQRTARDANLEKARSDWKATYDTPVTVDLGGGGTSVITAQPPPELPKAGQPAACTQYSVLTTTASGRAKQFETWCPNASGQMVRTEVKGDDAG